MTQNRIIHVLSRIILIATVGLGGEYLLLLILSFVANRIGIYTNNNIGLILTQGLIILGIVALTLLAIKTKRSELKAIFLIVPFQVLFILIITLMMLLVWPLDLLHSSLNLDIVWWILNLISIGVVYIYLVIKRKNWLYIVSATVGLIPITYLMFFNSFWAD